jgi:hypothetical protein
LSRIGISVRVLASWLRCGEREIELFRLVKPAGDLNSGVRGQLAECGAPFSLRWWWFYVRHAGLI